MSFVKCLLIYYDISSPIFHFSKYSYPYLAIYQDTLYMLYAVYQSLLYVNNCIFFFSLPYLPHYITP